MKAIICKILAVLIACVGLTFSIIEKAPLEFCGFALGGLIAYELAIIIEKNSK